MRAKSILVIALLIAPLAWGAVARDGTCSGTSTSCTFTGTATGDLKVIYAFNSSGTIPTVPAGWTTMSSGAPSTNAYAIGCNVSSSGSDTSSGTWTSTNRIIGISWSGTSVGTTANCNTTGIGGHAYGTFGSVNPISFTGITLTNASDWVVGMDSQNNATPCIPAGMTSVVTAGVTGQRFAGGDTEAPVSSWSTTNCTASAASPWISNTFEILAPAGASPPSLLPLLGVGF